MSVIRQSYNIEYKKEGVFLFSTHSIIAYLNIFKIKLLSRMSFSLLFCCSVNEIFMGCHIQNARKIKFSYIKVDCMPLNVTQRGIFIVKKVERTITQ